LIKKRFMLLFHYDFVSVTNLGVWSKVCGATVYLWLQYHIESAADLNVEHFQAKFLSLRAYINGRVAGTITKFSGFSHIKPDVLLRHHL
jgi:hypothetical protein